MDNYPAGYNETRAVTCLSLSPKQCSDLKFGIHLFCFNTGSNWKGLISFRSYETTLLRTFAPPKTIQDCTQLNCSTKHQTNAQCDARELVRAYVLIVWYGSSVVFEYGCFVNLTAMLQIVQCISTGSQAWLVTVSFLLYHGYNVTCIHCIQCQG